jgi:hypothetical protein
VKAPAEMPFVRPFSASGRPVLVTTARMRASDAAASLNYPERISSWMPAISWIRIAFYFRLVRRCACMTTPRPRTGHHDMNASLRFLALWEWLLKYATAGRARRAARGERQASRFQ